MLFIISGSSATVNYFTLKPQDVLMWMTDVRAIPAIGYHTQIKVLFREETRLNKCALILTLRPHPTAVDNIVQYYTGLVKRYLEGIAVSKM
ncbi:hypothetical protein DPMN_154353 [Dreissena polymorpha]|uniref:Uncharacterized protein n=1 Tax=Dreissena polymorpha TaxID=45954 RepID=A0A9D4FP23_DREPO|nr:hypothetical protein DPMN_154353 [Dreissena polymorpha]